MIHVNPRDFVKIVGELYEVGVRGILLSGGFRRDGTLPIEPYIEPLKRVKRAYKLVVSAHLGLVTNRAVLEELKGLIDVVDYEFSLSPFIVNEVRGLESPPSMYLKALEAHMETGLHVVPHVFAWHPRFDLELFKRELKVLEDRGVKEITLLVYIDQSMWREAIKIAEAVIKSVETARESFLGRLYMGCMRPGFIKPIVDPVLVEKELVERVANPHHRVVEKYPHDTYDACCSIPLNNETKEIFRLTSKQA
jgi:uncharacterized radical SAM superfamily protein